MDTQPRSTVPESEPLLTRYDGPAAVESHNEHDENAGENGEPSISDSLPKLGATSFDFFTTGVAMAAVGVLIPDMEDYYNINDTTAAFIFPARMLGYLLAAATVPGISVRFGLRAIAVLSPKQATQICLDHLLRQAVDV